jgi:hypothetical protein
LSESAGASGLMIMLVLDRIILFGFDIKGLKVFYQSNFNLNLIEDIEDQWLVFNAGAIEIAFHKIGKQYKNDKPFKAESNTKLVFSINQDISDFRKTLIQNGVLMGEIKSFDGIDFWHCDGEDIEGNVLQIRQKKF